MLQIICTLLVFLVIIFPIGKYVYHISTHKKTFADPLFDRIDNALYKILKIDTSNMRWKKMCINFIISKCMLSVCWIFSS